MGVPRLAVALVALLPGCLLEGEARHFPDESDVVVRMGANAYASPDGGVPREAVVESRGLDEDGNARAFRGELRIRLERQHAGDAQAVYEPLKEWTVEVDEGDFSSPTVPFHRFVIPPDALPSDGTYRVKVGARIGERDVPEGSALFAYVAR